MDKKKIDKLCGKIDKASIVFITIVFLIMGGIAAINATQNQLCSYCEKTNWTGNFSGDFSGDCGQMNLNGNSDMKAYCQLRKTAN